MLSITSISDLLLRSVRAQLVNMGNSQEYKTVVNSDLSSYGCTRPLELLYTSSLNFRDITQICADLELFDRHHVW
jgi:hypothetical protein